jgi:hypothetical protein
MTGWQALDEFLRIDPRDVGCEQAMEVLDIYVDVVSADGAEAAERRFPGVAACLRPVRRGLRRPARSRHRNRVLARQDVTVHRPRHHAIRWLPGSKKAAAGVAHGERSGVTTAR